MRIYDCFTFFSEFELLRLRCEELKHYNSFTDSIVHVLVEATTTHTGDEKRLYYSERQDEFNGRIDGIGYNIRHAVCQLPNKGDAWENENFQRDFIMNCLYDAQDDDIVIISDADEIPRWQAVQYYEPRMGIASLQMDKYSCYMNLLEGIQNWGIAKITTYGALKQTTPNKLRNGGRDFTIHFGGWHMSFLGGVDRMKEKLFAYAHSETVTSKLLDNLEYKFETGQSLWHTDYWRFVDIDSSFPKYLREHQEEFKHLIKSREDATLAESKRI